MEIDAARSVFAELGAVPDLVATDRLIRPRAAGSFGPLTAREVEVLTLAARGATNRSIGESLFVSDKTVARHLANIFAKLGVSSRAAATSWAYDRGLLEPPAPI
jgi:DNA-binding NarL/FixJ family response regulator